MKLRLVDRILAWQPYQRIHGVKVVSFEEYQLKEPLGDEPCLPDSLLVESLFQLGNWLIVLFSDFTQMAMVVRFEEIRFLSRVWPGENLCMEVEVRSSRNDGIVLDGLGRVGTRTIAEGKGCLAIPLPLADYQDPEALRVLYSEIYLPTADGRENSIHAPA